MRNGFITVLRQMPVPEIILLLRSMPGQRCSWSRIIMYTRSCCGECSQEKTGIRSEAVLMEDHQEVLTVFAVNV